MKLKSILLPILFVLTAFVVPSVGQAQLHDEMKELFESMLDELSPEVRKKFEEAIEKNSGSIEFTKDEFRKFRKNPVNPFDGMNEIDPAKLSGNIVLKFELPSLRTRRLDRNERQHPSQLIEFQPSAASVANSVVQITHNSKQVSFGTIIDGGILTKASELKNHSPLFCVFSNGINAEVAIKKIDKTNDLALLEVSAGSNAGLGALSRYGKPVEFSKAQPLPGAFVLSPNQRGKVFAAGTYSATPRSTAIGKRALLGVQPKTVAGGVQVEGIERNSAAFEADLRDGDIITRLDGIEMRDVGDLVNQIRKHQAGDSVDIEFRRGSENRTTEAQLAGLSVSGNQAAQFKMMSRLGAIPSRRNDNFPFVFQHDMPLFPEQCGGPVLDLDGNVIGINIARNGRASSYAIPTSHLQTIIADLKRDDVASRE